MSEYVLYVLVIPVVLICVYVVARFIFAAYFQSKKDFLNGSNHGRKN